MIDQGGDGLDGGVLLVRHGESSLRGDVWPPQDGAIPWPGERLRSTPAPTPSPRGPLLLLGDSLTEAGPWEEAFPDLEVMNAGVRGDTTADVAARLDDVVAVRPATVVVMAGTNESRRATVEQVVRGLEDILFHLRHELPDARLVVCSVLPRERERADWIREVNIHVRQFARHREGRVPRPVAGVRGGGRRAAAGLHAPTACTSPTPATRPGPSELRRLLG